LPVHAVNQLSVLWFVVYEKLNKSNRIPVLAGGAIPAVSLGSARETWTNAVYLSLFSTAHFEFSQIEIFLAFA
jgi:hypothetical protein